MSQLWTSGSEGEKRKWTWLQHLDEERKNYIIGKLLFEKEKERKQSSLVIYFWGEYKGKEKGKI